MNNNMIKLKMSGKKIVLAVLIVFAALTVLTPVSYGWMRPPDDRRDNTKSSRSNDSTAFFARYLRRSFQLAEKQLFEAYFILEHAEQINLSAKQQEEIESIMMTYQEATIRISAEIKILELRFASDIRSGDPAKIDKQKMENHIRLISRQKTDWVVIYINYLLDLRQVLKPDQLDMLTGISQENQKKRPKNRPFPPRKERSSPKNSVK